MGERRVTYVVSRWGEPTQTFVRREAAELRRSGYVVDALSIKPPVPSDDPTPVQHLGPVRLVAVAVAQLVRHPRRVAAVYRDLLRAASLRNIPYHLVAATIGVASAGHVRPGGHLHAHFGWTTATATWAIHRITRQPYSVVLHAFELYEDNLSDGFTATPLLEAAQVFTISDRDRRVVQTRWGVEPELLRMSVPGEWFTSAPTPERRAPKAVISVGSLVPKKGHDTLIAAMAHLDADWTLRIAGTGPEATKLEQLVRNLRLQDRVTFLGAVPETTVRAELDSSMVFVLACTVADDHNQDGIPVAIMEAMARGMPVVSTRVGAIEELVEGVGLLVRDRDPEALAESITTLHDDQQWARVAAAGQARVRSDYVPDVTLQPLLRLLDTTVPPPASELSAQ